MEKPFSFRFEGKERLANIHISLQDDGCYIFTIIKDAELINRFGEDIDFEIQDDFVKRQDVVDSGIYELQTAILRSAKQLPEYQQQNGQLKIKVKAELFG